MDIEYTVCIYLLYCRIVTYFIYITGNKNDFALLSKSNFAMIKYPRNGHSIPHERVFKMDFENLVCEDESFTVFTVVVFTI